MFAPLLFLHHLLPEPFGELLQRWMTLDGPAPARSPLYSTDARSQGLPVAFSIGVFL